MRAFSPASFWLPVLVTTLVAAFFGALLGRRGRDLEIMLQAEAVLDARLARLEAENARLRAERDELLSSPQAIERIAREEYGFAAPGEQVTEFPTGPPQRTGRPAAERSPSLLSRLLVWRHLPLVLAGAAFLLSAALFAALNLIRQPEPDE